ncbi:wax ester/triacylglycerol synthase family O-acyltransferase [Marinicella sp. S1101]|uniref:WS/DGAT/MGAT family O-acyltransferase n=1 Tax=Marinicella marina TaxID=2996016 RepID=UPI002260C1D0|nr:wax ester/triacylglycerol synthase family O-acyltransferase [Marinicella marina]MCX7553572.1 wax ester/triacylglycerol synthase family O-acyltransferase [Marinicella marina]MDJ1140196.1 wax ester/triacylglycerol synthase family O-acyltransferase [Marinicella marina]
MQPLSGLDSSFLYLETDTQPMHVGSVNVYEGSLSFEDFKSFLLERLPLAPRLFQRLVQVPMSIDHPYWVDDPNFDIDMHLHHTALPRPGDWQALRKLASRIFAQKLDRNRPLWEFVFVEGLDQISQVPKGSVAVISKIHHAAIDGASGAAIMGLLFDVTEKPRKIPAMPLPDAEALPGDFTLIRRSAMNYIKRPFKLPGLLLETAKSTWKAGRLSRVQSKEIPRSILNAPPSILNQPVTSKRLWNSTLLDLQRVKDLRVGAKGATLNDVVLTICTGALRRYLHEKDALPEKPLVAMIPVSTRTEGEQDDMGNQVSAMLVQLPTTEADPVKQLQKVHQHTDQGKAYQNAIGAKQLIDYTEFIPFALGSAATRMYTRMNVSNHHRPFFNLIITNVPGPQIPLYMNGHKMLANMGMAPVFDGMGLIMPVLSYNGTLSISPTVAANVMPDVDLFTQYIRESANELEANLQALSLKKGSKRSKKKAKPKNKSPKK